MECDHTDSSSTPKLSFYNTFPSKKREPQGMVTLPPQTASIPFHWEEAPGKPRAPLLLKSSKTSSVRCLVPPPPRLMNTNDGSNSTKFTSMPSPTTVLGGPYSSCPLPHEERLRGHRRRRDGKERLNFTSWRWSWGSYKEFSRISGGTKGSNDFSLAAGVGDGNESDHTKVNITTTRVFRRRRRSNSFLSLSTTTSSLLSSIYESFKQAVPWKRRPDK